MGQLTYNSLRIYKQNKSSFTLKEMESLKAFIFNSPYYFSQQFRFVSRFTPLIFELTDNDLCIEAQFNTYNDYVVRENIERLYEMTFPTYDFWFITANDSSCIDQIGRFKSLNLGENDYASTSRDDWRTCLYKYDRIVLTGLSSVPEKLKHIEFQKKGDQLVSVNCDGMYNSYSEKNYTDGQRYKLIPEEHTISLKEKYDTRANGIDLVSVGEEFYSDPELAGFIRKQLIDCGATALQFYFEDRLTRIISAESNGSVLAFDGWDNCGDEEFANYVTNLKMSDKLSAVPREA